MKKNLIILASLLASLGMNAQTASVSSPDGKLVVNFDIKDTKPMYEVIYDGKQMLDYSPLGFVADNGDYTQGITFESTTANNDGVFKASYKMDRSKYSDINVEFNWRDIHLKNKNGNKFDIHFVVKNNDVAFRYCIENQPSRQNGKKFSIRIMKEATGFDFPHQTTTFLTPQSHAMIGWKGTKPSYEEEYKYDEPMTSKSQYGHGYTFPALFHVNALDKNDKDGWVLVSETDVDSRYCGSRLSDMKGDGLYTIEFPMPEENGGNGTIEPAMKLPNYTPWRTITVGTSLKPIVETTIPWDFVEPRYEASQQYKYGKGTWSWIVWQDNSINTKDLLEYAKLSKAMGYEYMLIDNWWDNNIGYEKMEEFVKTVQGMGVDVFLWWSSSGYWNDIEQGPINKMDNPIERKKVMRWMKKLGVKGIKVDFFGGDKQETMRLYEAILSDANDNGLMVIFHGCTIPRGWERMYPNYVGSEAVLASENIYFTQGAADKEAKDAATHPFIRNAIGCMEFGGCFMNRHINRGNKGGNTRRTTDVHELATCVLFQNPVQNFAITPENLGDEGNVKDYNAEGAPAPKLCMDFLRSVPTTWDETVYIDGYPGKYAIVARRSGNLWYIAGNNATGRALTLKLNLPMLSKGDEVCLYSDNMKSREPQHTSLKVKNPAAVTITMADQGGFVIVK
ncbi:MAG: glycoside hydrolase family 97 protein [Bacteroidaceae bacterium]|nr:glycoside hydrolase family 97 protein [Bacteroidaceae bacterium]